MIGSIGLFVLFSNLISVVPGLASPTAEVSVPLGCAIVVFLYYHWSGLRKHGPVHYGKHFMGPNIYLSPLMVVVEAVSHLARLLSLTVRLWVNMMVSEMLYGIFLGLTLALFLFRRQAERSRLRAGAAAAAGAGDFHHLAYFRGVRAGVCVHDFAGDLSQRGGCGRALISIRRMFIHNGIIRRLA